MKIKLRFKILLVIILVLGSLNFVQKRLDHNGNDLLVSILQNHFNVLMADTVLKHQQDIIIEEKVNTKLLNEVLYNCVEELQKQIKAEQRYVVATMPIGALSGVTWLQDTGFSIPIKYTLIERIRGRVDIQSSDLGINNALIQINLIIDFSIQATLGFTKKELIFHESLPLAIEYIQGDVPQLYSY